MRRLLGFALAVVLAVTLAAACTEDTTRPGLSGNPLSNAVPTTAASSGAPSAASSSGAP